MRRRALGLSLLLGLGFPAAVSAEALAPSPALPADFTLSYEEEADQLSLLTRARVEAAFAGKYLVLIVGHRRCPACVELKRTLEKPSVHAPLSLRFAVRSITYLSAYRELPSGRAVLAWLGGRFKTQHLPIVALLEPRTGALRQIELRGLRPGPGQPFAGGALVGAFRRAARELEGSGRPSLGYAPSGGGIK